MFNLSATRPPVRFLLDFYIHLTAAYSFFDFLQSTSTRYPHNSWIQSWWRRNRRHLTLKVCIIPRTPITTKLIPDISKLGTIVWIQDERDCDDGPDTIFSNSLTLYGQELRRCALLNFLTFVFHVLLPVDSERSVPCFRPFRQIATFVLSRIQNTAVDTNIFRAPFWARSVHCLGWFRNPKAGQLGF